MLLRPSTLLCDEVVCERVLHGTDHRSLRSTRAGSDLGGSTYPGDTPLYAPSSGVRSRVVQDIVHLMAGIQSQEISEDGDIVKE